MGRISATECPTVQIPGEKAFVTTKTGVSPKKKPKLLSTWDQIVKHLGQYPSPRLSFDSDGEVNNQAWIFRGVSNSAYPLEPSVERTAKNGHIGWAALEVKVVAEFKSRARMHIGPTLIPEDELTWLALMQHYGIPTRLLDFTLSPFVALYFAVRHGGEKSTPARVWAMDSEAINGNFLRVTARARIRARERKKTPGHKVSFHLDDFASERDVLRDDALAMRRAAEEALQASGTFRSELNKHGCACMTMPPSFNPRLASQQGVFLLNCAEKLTFDQSLEKMMVRNLRSRSGVLSRGGRSAIPVKYPRPVTIPRHGRVSRANQAKDASALDVTAIAMQKCVSACERNVCKLLRNW